ncbi:efflux transporter outer membrane subunit [Parachlamydia acanthamoebae]|uniref:Outer membrane protein OprM n=1 Tax=Parachlamydia acanthamoebae (strain UV7) TaxID=765952 RepID=F8KUX0_PARAV|nr:efflux transporter outer membrane subunit [Parachlamydia acanthamoebae]CCB85035.1 putative uncharacterized protein [Parachlamydia acanthamoebae UV-7]
MKFSIHFLLFALFLTSGCMVGPDYRPPCIDAPAAWKGPNEGPDFCEEVENWWEIFDDQRLNNLEALAVSNNRNLFAAFERVQEARYRAGVVAADLYPQFTLDPLYSNQEVLLKTLGAPSTFLRVHELLYNLPLNLSYQMDLWGRLTDQYYAAKYTWEAQIEDYRLVLLNLTTDLATAYYQLRAADSQIDLLIATLKTRNKAFDINKSRYEAKIVNYSDVSRAGLEVQNALTQYEEMVRQRNVLENRIAVLLGVQPSEFFLEHMPLTTLPPRIPAGIPSEVLLQRPDIAEIERNMASAHALVKAAYASFFPSLELTGLVGYSSPALKYFLKHKSFWWMYGASMDQTVFDGFRKTDNLCLQWSTFKEIGYQYQQQVFVAFQEVENALSDIQQYAEEYESSKKAVEWAKTTTKIARDRYFQGVTFYLDVMDSERDELSAEIIQNNLQGLRFVSTIQLINALGGSWNCD